MRSVFDKHCSNLEFEINQLIAAHEQRMREEEALWKREQEEERLREVEARRKREQAEQRLRAEDSRRNREQEEERRRAEDARWQREQEEERLRKEEEWLRTREEYFKRVDEKQRRRDEEQELRWLKLKLKRRRRFYVELVVFSALYSTVLLPLWFPSRERYDLPGWYWGGVGIFGFSVMWGGFRMYADGNSGGIVFKLFAIVPLFIFVAFGLVPALDRAIHVYSMLGAQSGF